MDEIRAFFPNVFDATSGHIPIDLINEIARRIKKEIHPIDKQYIVETGSGETLLVLSIAFPEIKFKPEYNTNKATAFNKEAPLNDLIAAISKTQKPTAAS